MTDPVLVDLPPDLVELQQRWLALGRQPNSGAQRVAFYAHDFGPRFAPLFATLPLHGAPADMARPQPSALISVLGLSWQPAALMAAWCRPERMLLIGTDESFRPALWGEGIQSLIAGVAGLSRDAIRDTVIDAANERDIYQAVRNFLGESAARDNTFVDVTGGKKSMSAAAALAGFVTGARLVYVDYGTYLQAERAPLPGTEYPRLLSNPLEMLGDLEMRDIFAAFDRSDFAEAERLAGRLVPRLDNPRQAQCLAAMARGYGAWDSFEFGPAQKALGSVRDLLLRFGERGAWLWAPAALPAVDRAGAALGVLAAMAEWPQRIADGVPLLGWYLSKAQRMLRAQNRSLAVLLSYAALERYVDLCLRIDWGLDDRKPDYDGVWAQCDQRKYHEAGRSVFGSAYVEREPGGPLYLTNGAQLLAVLPGGRLDQRELPLLRDVAAARNRCEYEHGFLPTVPSPADADRYLKIAQRVVSGAEARAGDLQRWIEACSFPVLTPPG